MPRSNMFHLAKDILNIIIQGYKDCGYRDTYIVISKIKK